MTSGGHGVPADCRVLANPAYSLHTAEALSSRAAGTLRSLGVDTSTIGGVLIARSGSGLPDKLVDHAGAAAFAGLAEPGSPPAAVAPRLAELVMDGVLALQVDGELLAGPQAWRALWAADTAPPARPGGVPLPRRVGLRRAAAADRRGSPRLAPVRLPPGAVERALVTRLPHRHGGARPARRHGTAPGVAAPVHGHRGLVVVGTGRCRHRCARLQAVRQSRRRIARRRPARPRRRAHRGRGDPLQGRRRRGRSAPAGQARGLPGEPCRAGDGRCGTGRRVRRRRRARRAVHGGPRRRRAAVVGRRSSRRRRTGRCSSGELAVVGRPPPGRVPRRRPRRRPDRRCRDRLRPGPPRRWTASTWPRSSRRASSRRAGRPEPAVDDPTRPAVGVGGRRGDGAGQPAGRADPRSRSATPTSTAWR